MDDVPAGLAAALADRYALEHEIGRGGMATVYLARDLKHPRHVAIKMLRPELAATLGADRFLKEIEIAAALSHPHILPLHDSGQVGDTLYYVMPFVDGESLRGLLARSGTLERERALEITGQVADALGYAHRQGVLHRDIKPENILMAEGHPVVADFGIAKAVRTAGGVELTRTGFPLGTPGYMSPEQAAGDTDLDARTDVYSLACVCYEMLVGEVPGRWLTDEVVRVGMFLEASDAHRARLDRLPGGIEQALVRALALRAEQRFDTPEEFSLALRRPPDGLAKRYRPDEAAEIVRRAAELDGAEPTVDDSMTVGGVQRIAAEVGLPPERVRDAIRPPEIRGEARPPSRWLGAPAELVFETYIDGSLPEIELERILEEVRIATGREGYARIHGGALNWSARRPPEGRNLGEVISDSMQSPPRMAVHVVPRGGRTRIRVEQQLDDTAWSIFGGILGGMGLGGIATSLSIAGAFGLWELAVSLAVLVGGGSYPLSRSIYRSVVRSKRRKLEELFDRIVECAGEVTEE